MQLKKATRLKAKLRMGLFGPSGSGKTYSALLLAHGLCGDWEKIALIDTERGSGDLYSDLGGYSTLTLEAPFTPERYVKAIKECEDAGMEVIIIDSISHEWEGTGGIIEIKDSLPGNSFTNWAKITPRHNKFIDAILTSKCHVICCGRAKQDYVLTEQISKNGNKIQVPEKVGLKAVTREGFDYEVTLAFDIDIKHNAHCAKDRTRLFVDQPAFMISQETGEKLIVWLNSGAAVEASVSLPTPTPEIITQEQPEPAPSQHEKAKRMALLITRLIRDYGLSEADVKTYGAVNSIKIAMDEADVEGLTKTYNSLLELIKVDGRQRVQAPSPEQPVA